MSFVSLRLASFRNLADAEISLGAERVFLIGENGQGKTNILEALYYLSYGASFRGPVDAEAARAQAGQFVLEGGCAAVDSRQGMPPEEIRVAWNGRTKEIRRNGKVLRDRKELVELNPSVVFCHEDFAFAAGEPERRRFFFDQTAGIVSAGYIDLLRDYKRVLKQRNAALKESRLDILDLLDEQYAAAGLRLIVERQALRSELYDIFSRRYEAVSLLGRAVELSYKPSWPAAGGLDAALEKIRLKRHDELALGTSLSGPHRDRWNFMVEGKDFAATASTGQLRLISITLRMVQAEYYTTVSGKLPVLLLDDVLLELDPGKRRRFLELLPGSAQAFFTFLPGEPWEDYRTASTRVYHVNDGRLSD